MQATCRPLGDGRLHFQHGPMDIVLGAEGDAAAVRQAHAQAWERFRGLLQELVQGTARSAIHYRTLIKPLLQRAQKDTLVEALLLLGTHQLLAMRSPDHAALAETVEAARQLGLDKLTGFINGVLRSLQRREAELVHAALIQEHAHPAWLLRALAGKHQQTAHAACSCGFHGSATKQA